MNFRLVRPFYDLTENFPYRMYIDLKDVKGYISGKFPRRDLHVHKDFVKFQTCMVPSQQAALPNLAEGPFFAATTGYQIDNEFDTNVTATSASVMASLYFTPDKKEFSTINWVLRQEGGQWYIDLDETVRGEKARNGANAFQSWIIKVQKR